MTIDDIIRCDFCVIFLIFDNVTKIENDVISQPEKVLLKCPKIGLQCLFTFLYESFAYMQKSQIGYALTCS